MARLIDARAAVELDPMVGHVVVTEFDQDTSAQTELVAAPLRGSGARLDRSLELMDWFDVVAG